jgi:hypothetical protein
MKRCCCSIFFAFFIAAGYASSIDKGFSALHEYDYFKAKKIFYSELKKHKAEAAYGLATIYYRHDNPFHRLDSAYKYVYFALQSWKTYPAEKKAELGKKFGLTDSAIISLHDSVSYQAYTRLLRKPGIEAAESYLATYYISPYSKKVICLRDSFAFISLQEKITSQRCREFLYTYPQSCYADEVRNLLSFSLYAEITAAKDDKGYLDYLQKYPSGKYAQLAREELLNYYIVKKNKEGIYSQIKGSGIQYAVNYAWNMLLSLEAPNHSKQELEDFLNKYPDYPLRTELEEEFKYWHMPLLIIKKNELQGFCDTTGRVIIEPQFNEEENFSEGYALVQKGELYGYISKTGKTKIEPQFTDAESFSNHVAIVQKNNSFYLIDHSNKPLSAGYDEIADFSEGLAIVKKSGRYGAVNRNGDEVIKPVFETLGDFSEGFAPFQKNGKYGFSDKQGFTAIPPVYDWVGNFRNGLCRVQFNKYFGLINRKGDFVIEPAFDLVDEAAKGIYLVVKNNLYGFVDSTGCSLSELKYLYNPALKADMLANEKFMRLITAKKQDLQNRNGQKYFADQNYEEVSLPVNNLVIVKERNKYGLFSLTKNAFVKKSLTAVSTDGKYWYIEGKKGLSILGLSTENVLFTLEADKITHLTESYFVFEGEDGNGLVDDKGIELLPAGYDEIKTTEVPGIIYIERNEKGAYFHISARSFIWKEDGF